MAESDPFADARRHHQSLLQDYQSGRLGESAFAEALEELKFEDDQQRWWQIQGDGNWLCFDQGQWRPAQPPRRSPPPPPRAALIPPPRREFASQEEDIFANTGKPIEVHSVPAPASVLLELAREVAVEPPRPLPVKVACQTLQERVQRPPDSPLSAPPPLAPAPAPAPAQAERPAPTPTVQPATVRCPHCRQNLVEGARFCGSCGHSPESMLCPGCSCSNPQTAKFCKKCGRPLKKKEPA